MKIFNANFKIRILFSFAIVLLIIPTIMITYYGLAPGRIIGMIIYMMIAILAVFEVAFLVVKNKLIALFFSLALIILNFFLPFDVLVLTIENGRGHLTSWYNIKTFLLNNFEWQIWIVPIFAVVFLLVLSKELRSDLKRMFVVLPILFFITYVSVVFSKGVWLINIYEWQKLIFMLSISIVSDTFAYLGGSLWGQKLFKKKFAPHISPNKTWEGFFVSLIITTIFTAIVGYYINFWPTVNYHWLIAFSSALGLSLIAQISDLLFSVFKRYFKTKDFSNLIPGHGGVFDRIDSMSVTFFFITILLIVI